MPNKKELILIKQLLDTAESNIRQAKSLFFSSELAVISDQLLSQNEGQIVEGIFDGEKMLGQNDKTYSVPANYASKSKLVAGDTLKLTILEDGSFVFKQIGPIKRKKLIGILEDIGDNRYIVTAGQSKFKVLPASVSYFKAKDGDSLTILVPEDLPSDWAAVENLL